MKHFTPAALFASLILTYASVGCAVSNDSIQPAPSASADVYAAQTPPNDLDSPQHRQLIRTVGFRGNRADPLGR